jgi:hypothetical protein
MGLAERTADGQKAAVKGWLSVLEQKNCPPGKAGATKTAQKEAAEARRIRKLRAAATRNGISNRKFEI